MLPYWVYRVYRIVSRAVVLLGLPDRWTRERGVTAAEYALVIMFGGLAVVSAVIGFGPALAVKCAGMLTTIGGL